MFHDRLCSPLKRVKVKVEATTRKKTMPSSICDTKLVKGLQS